MNIEHHPFNAPRRAISCALFRPQRRLNPLAATLTRASHESETIDHLTPFFSSTHFHSSALFVTLKPVSPAFATLTKSTPGYTLPPKSPFPFWNVHRAITLPHDSTPIRLTTPHPAPKMKLSQPNQTYRTTLLKLFTDNYSLRTFSHV